LPLPDVSLRRGWRQRRTKSFVEPLGPALLHT